ncbi:hypothetical protein CWI56_09855, partial [Neisseria meningitidis]
GRDFGQGFACFRPPAAVVSRRGFFFGFLPAPLLPLFASIAAVGIAFCPQLGGCFILSVEAAGLLSPPYLLPTFIPPAI